jgi:hypothetical protein
MTHLIAGYSNGGFTLWELRQDDPTHITELTSYQPSHLSSEKCNQKVNMICMEYPIIVVCTEEMKLSIFNVYPSLQLVHHLQSSNFWSPVIFDIQKVNNTTQPTWKIMTCFGIDLGNNSSSLGVQVRAH